jgi:hypothetical protein
MVQPLIPNPALLIGDVLVVTDLHLGFEGELREHGIRIPSQTNQILQELLNIIERAKARRLVILGDVKHGVPSISYDEWRHIPRFLETLSSKVSSLDIIMGNHDGDLLPLTPRIIRIHPPQGMKVGDAWLVHGHALPAPEARNAGFVVMGHIHPAIELTDRFGFRLIQPVWLKCRGKSSTVVVMPPFNRLIGHLLINKRGHDKFGPALRWAKIDIDECEAFTLDGTLLGRIKGLRA